MGFFKNMMKGAATKGVGGIIDAGFGALNAGLNYYLGEKAADAADARQRAQFKDMYSLEAQMRQIKEAGLSPSMFFSGGLNGQGGANAPQGSGASGPMFNSSPLDVQAVAAANELDSRANLNNAQAELLGEQTIKQKWDNFITSNTAKTTIKMKTAQLNSLLAETQYTMAQTEGQEFTNEFNKEQREKLVQELDYKLENLYMDIWLKASENTKNYAQAKNFNEQITYWMGDIKAKARANEIQQQNADTQQEWCRKQAEAMMEDLKIKKFIAKLDAEELGLKRTATETEKLNVWLDFAASLIQSILLLHGAEVQAGAHIIRGFTPR